MRCMTVVGSGRQPLGQVSPIISWGARSGCSCPTTCVQGHVHAYVVLTKRTGPVSAPSFSPLPSVTFPWQHRVFRYKVVTFPWKQFVFLATVVEENFFSTVEPPRGTTPSVCSAIVLNELSEKQRPCETRPSLLSQRANHPPPRTNLHLRTRDSPRKKKLKIEMRRWRSPKRR